MTSGGSAINAKFMLDRDYLDIIDVEVIRFEIDENVSIRRSSNSKAPTEPAR
jgi:hypothetical protein